MLRPKGGVLQAGEREQFTGALGVQQLQAERSVTTPCAEMPEIFPLQLKSLRRLLRWAFGVQRN